MGTSEKTISFRALAKKIDTLDSLAAAQDRSRSYLINEPPRQNSLAFYAQ